MLLSAAAVRHGANRILTLALDGLLDDWVVDLERLPITADFVANVVRERYPRPTLHCTRAGGISCSRAAICGVRSRHAEWHRPAAARAAIDLVTTSVLLDAGAGPGWRYHDADTGLIATRSEGLALASLRWFQSGAVG
jgi:hypothetical protein